MSRARDLANGTFSGAFSADSPTLVVDAANNRVGLDTTSPTVKLDVNQSQALTSITSPANAALRLQNTNGGADNYYTALSFTTSTTSVGTDSVIASFSETAGNSALTFWTDTSNGMSEKMRITSAGNVGIGTTSPTSDLTVKNTSNSFVDIISGTSNYAGVRFGDTTDNVTGGVYFNHSTNALSLYGYNNVERLMIDVNGDLQYGKTDGSQNTQGIILNSYGTIRANSQADVALHLIRSTAGNIVRFYHNNTTLVGNINVTSTGTSYNTTSDYRLKENVTELTGAIDRVKQVPVHRFNFIADPDKTVDGFLAHEVADVVPEAITGEKDGMRTEEYEVTPAVLDDDGNVVTEAVMATREVIDPQAIDQSKLVPLLTAAIKEQQALIEDLQTRLAALEAV